MRKPRTLWKVSLLVLIFLSSSTAISIEATGPSAVLSPSVHPSVQSSPPTNPYIWGIGATNITLNWSNAASGGAPTSNTIAWSTTVSAGACSSATTHTTGSAATSYTITGLTTGTKYCVQVAETQSGKTLSAYTVTLNATPSSNPSAGLNYLGVQEVTINNLGPMGTVNNSGQFQENISYPSNTQPLLNSNWTNVKVAYSNGTFIQTWVERNATSSATHTILWLKLWAIPGFTAAPIFFLFYAKSSFQLSVTGPTGQNASLTSSYGTWDNGAQVFLSYTNWSGSSVTLIGTLHFSGLSDAQNNQLWLNVTSTASFSLYTNTYFIALNLLNALSATSAKMAVEQWAVSNAAGQIANAWYGPGVCEGFANTSSYVASGIGAYGGTCMIVRDLASNNRIGIRTPNNGIAVAGSCAPVEPTNSVQGMYTTNNTWMGGYISSYITSGANGQCVGYTHNGGTGGYPGFALAAQTMPTSTGNVLISHWFRERIMQPFTTVSVISELTYYSVIVTPAAPTGVAAATVSAGVIAVTWTNPSGTLTNLTVFYVSGAGCAGFNQRISTGAGTNVSRNVGSLSGATQYSFVVVAYNAAGASPASNCATAWTDPAAPTGVSAVISPPTTLTVSWTLPSGTLTNNTVYYQIGSSCKSSGFTSAKGGIALGATSTTITVTANQNYIVVVQSNSAGGPSAVSSCVEAGGFPGAPTINSVSFTSMTAVSVAWTDANTPVSNNTIYYQLGTTCKTSGFTHAQTTTSGSPTAISGLTAGNNYIFAMTSKNATGTSAISSCVEAAGYPSAPTIVSVAIAPSTTLTVTWTLPSGSLSNVTVYYQIGTACKSSGFTSAQGGLSASATSTTISVMAGNNYIAVVQVNNATGASPVSGCLEAAGFPTAPTGVAAAIAPPTTLTVSWVLPPGTLSNVTVYYQIGTACKSSGFTSAKGGISPVATSTTITITANKNYIAVVQVNNATGASPVSPCVEAGGFPGAPTIVSVSFTSTTSVSVSWTDPNPPISNNTIFFMVGTSCVSSGYTHAQTTTLGSPTTVSGLTANRNYLFVMTDTNATGTSVVSNCVEAAGYPSAPTGVTAVIAPSTTLTVSWTNPAGLNSNNTVYYQIGTACKTSGFTTAKTVTPISTSTTIAITAFQNYIVVVQVTNATGSSSVSSCVEAAGFPGAPTITGVTFPTTSSASIAWTDPNPPTLNRTIYYTPGTVCRSSGFLHAFTTTSASPTTISGLTVGVDYIFIMSSTNVTGTSLLSNCAPQVPTPTNLAALFIGLTFVDLIWSDPAHAFITNVTVQWGVGASCSSFPSSLSGPGPLTLNVTGLVNATTYCFHVAALTNGTLSSYSAPLVAATLAFPNLGPPYGLRSTGQTTNAIALAWFNPNAYLTNDTVWWGPNCALLVFTQSTNGRSTFFLVTGLVPSTTYCFAVQAWQNRTGSPLSTPIYASTFALSGPGGGGGGGGCPANCGSNGGQNLQNGSVLPGSGFNSQADWIFLGGLLIITILAVALALAPDEVRRRRKPKRAGPNDR